MPIKAAATGIAPSAKARQHANGSQNERPSCFLIHVLPKGFHRIRHDGLFAGTAKHENLKRMRELIEETRPERASKERTEDAADPKTDEHRERHCPCCGARVRIVETFERGQEPRHRPSHSPAAIRIDTS